MSELALKVIKMLASGLSPCTFAFFNEKKLYMFNPNNKYKLMIPFVFGLEIRELFFLEKVLLEDSFIGDQDGPYDTNKVASNREKAQEEQKMGKFHRTITDSLQK